MKSLLPNKVEEVRRERAKSDRVKKVSHKIGFTPLTFHTAYHPDGLNEVRVFALNS